MEQKFDPNTQTFLEPITSGNLKFKSRTGEIFNSQPTDSLLASGGVGQVDLISKYRNTIKTTAYDPINPRIKLSKPCTCGREVVSYQRLGEEKNIVYVCLCGKTTFKTN